MKQLYKIFIGVIILTIFQQPIYSQRNRWKAHNFKDSTNLSPVDEKYQDEDAVIIKRVNLIEYKGFIDYKIQKTSYKLIKINNDIGLEAFNRIYIPMYGVSKIIDIQVRFISPNGEVTNLNRNDIRKIENLEGYGDFTVFAIKGAEIGGEIEYKYTLKMMASFSHIDIFYNKYPIQEARFELVAPSDLRIYIKGYNGFPEFEVDNKGRKAWYATLYDVEPFENEMFALNTSNRIKVAFGVNKYGEQPYEYWSKMIEQKHSFLYNFTKSHERLARKISLELKLIDKELPQKIETIRSFAMDSIKYIDGFYMLDFRTVLEDKIAVSTQSKYKMMSILFYVNNIPFETLWATDKYFAEYIPEYPFSFNHDGFLFYFPENNLFLDPANRMYPLGYIPYKYLDTDAFFIQKRSKRLEHIYPLDKGSSKELVDLKIKIDSNWKVNIKSRYEMHAYGAAEWRSFLNMIDKDKEKEIFEELHSTHMFDLSMNSVQIENDSLDINNYHQLPLIINFDMESEMIIDHAGKDYIFNLGRLLRNSKNFYHEEERIQDIVFNYPEVIHTSMEFEIPNGYQIENLSILKQNEIYRDSTNNIQCFLETDYTLEDRTVKFYIKEGFLKCRYPSEDYQSIMKVINAISDLSFLKLAFIPENNTPK